MKIDNIPDYIDPSLNLEQIRDECQELIQKRAYVSAGAAIVPIPFFDVVVDLGILSQLIPDINSRFGLAPEHVSVYDPKTKTIHWDELRKRGFQFSGFVVARTTVKKTFNGFFGKIALYTTNFTEPLSYQGSAFLKLPKFP
ncbi:putative Zn-dependent peptidase [Acinetobacter baumannii]|nr:putative Zn-dependent peptidase [Acinetobacter baumannii]